MSSVQLNTGTPAEARQRPEAKTQGIAVSMPWLTGGLSGRWVFCKKFMTRSPLRGRSPSNGRDLTLSMWQCWRYFAITWLFFKTPVKTSKTNSDTLMISHVMYKNRIFLDDGLPFTVAGFIQILRDPRFSWDQISWMKTILWCHWAKLKWKAANSSSRCVRVLLKFT